MDLGLQGKKAIVCASSRGLGLACAEALAAEGVHVVINGRDRANLENVAATMAAKGWAVTPIAADVTTREGQEALAAACPEPDILVNNCAGPNPRDFMLNTEEDWRRALESNMVAPLMLVRRFLSGMQERRFGRIVNITSAMVTTPRPHMTLSAGARGGLTAALKGLSLAAAPYNVTINNLLPERFDTQRQVDMAHDMMKRHAVTYEEARAMQVRSIAARRLGDPREFGATCAFVCSGLAGFMSGQNLHLDGGSYPALV
ncbi:SDR family oxidoreductase [Novosphingobium resinovorum]|uniref:3-oxoacyl-ACP reductase n=1 Tax=Novosphingobium resinovorum TaxID=158500 RepID=A0A1D8A6N4_9SPHN|nr:SDR family oxidoreductase [Novosphingobium resinovorum]AOR77777.1 3-oxoacyl-ACP reductase [Novosphingobium resinovorum]